MKNKSIAIFVLILTIGASFFAGRVSGKTEVNMPKTVIHHVALQWKKDVSDADKAKALDGLKEVLSEVPGVKNLWMKTIKVQPKEFSQTFVVEFEDEAALKAYADNPNKKKWDDFYYSIREVSQNCVTTN
jgi:Stress responsive A/B Barrel Domain